MRIIGGRARGRRIRAPKGMRVRPTSDRVRESLFSILGPRVEGTSVLDLFSGSGSLGLEALSRGADRACFVERSWDAARILTANVAGLGFGEESRLLRMDWRGALGLLSSEGASFDLVFADPPYEKGGGAGLGAAVVEALDNLPALFAPGFLLVLEHFAGEEVEPPLERLEPIRREIYGETALSFYRLKETEAAGPSAMQN